MKLPNADHAVIAPEKLRDYLLLPSHRRGGSKARLLLSLGSDSREWIRLDQDIRSQHLNCETSETEENLYGLQFVIIAPIATPSGRSVTFRSVWQVDTGTELPRLNTMYPE
jgi:hypothetical protein